MRDVRVRQNFHGNTLAEEQFKRDLNRTLQPNSAFINFRDIWSLSRQLLLLTVKLRPLGPVRGGPKGDGGRTNYRAGAGHVPRAWRPGYATYCLRNFEQVIKPVSSPTEWRLSSLPPQAVEVTHILSLDLLYTL